MVYDIPLLLSLSQVLQTLQYRADCVGTVRNEAQRLRLL